MKSNVDVVIIGCGIAGMTAAIYLKRSNYNVVILEKNVPGGQIINAFKVENYPGFTSVSGADLAYSVYEQVNNLGIEVKFEAALEISEVDNMKIVKTDDSKYACKAIVLATGRSPRSINAKNEEKYIGKGISYCATCDGALYRDKDVVVVGGGNSAVGESIFLAGICKKVTLIHRSEVFKAEQELIDKMKSLSNIEIVMNSEIVEYIGDNNILRSVVVEDIDKNKSEIETEAVFLFVGSVPNSELLKNLNILNEYNYINVNNDMLTDANGIFACGDSINKKVYQLVTATGEGAIAADSVKEYIEKSK